MVAQHHPKRGLKRGPVQHFFSYVHTGDIYLTNPVSPIGFGKEHLSLETC